MRTAIATAETVEQAISELMDAGEEPTVERVRRTLGGGSYSTINKLLAQTLAQRKANALKVEELPPDLMRLGVDHGTKLVAEIYARVSRTANTKVADTEAIARDQIAAAEAACSEARREIERLEIEQARYSSAMVEAQGAASDAKVRAAVAEGRAEAQAREIERLERELSSAHDVERRSIAEVAELRGQLAALRESSDRHVHKSLKTR